MVSQRLLNRQDVVIQQQAHLFSKQMKLGSLLGRISLTQFHKMTHLHQQPVYESPGSSSEEVSSSVARGRVLPSPSNRAQMIQQVMDHLTEELFQDPEQFIQLGTPMGVLQLQLKFMHQLGLALLTLPDWTQELEHRVLS